MKLSTKMNSKTSIKISLKMIALLLAASAVSTAQADDFGLGLSLGYASSPYKEHDKTLLPMPLLSYEGERFFIRATGLGAYLWKDKVHAISAGISYRPLHFDPSKTSNQGLSLLDERDATASVDLQYAARTDYGMPSLKISRDVIGDSDGLSIDAAYRYPFKLSPPITFTPGAGMIWENKKRVAYYYGVSDAEALRSGITAYAPSAATSTYLSFEGVWKFAERWQLHVGGRGTFVGSEIEDSPMVDKNHTFSSYLGMQHRF